MRGEEDLGGEEMWDPEEMDVLGRETVAGILLQSWL